MSFWLLKNNDCLTTIAPLIFIIIHLMIHTAAVEIGTPALSSSFGFKEICMLS